MDLPQRGMLKLFSLKFWFKTFLCGIGIYNLQKTTLGDNVQGQVTMTVGVLTFSAIERLRNVGGKWFEIKMIHILRKL